MAKETELEVIKKNIKSKDAEKATIERVATAKVEAEIGEELAPLKSQLQTIQNALNQLNSSGQASMTSVGQNQQQSNELLNQMQQFSSQAQQQQQKTFQQLQQSIHQATQMLSNVEQSLQSVNMLNQIAQQINQSQQQLQNQQQQSQQQNQQQQNQNQTGSNLYQ